MVLLSWVFYKLSCQNFFVASVLLLIRPLRLPSSESAKPAPTLSSELRHALRKQREMEPTWMHGAYRRFGEATSTAVGRGRRRITNCYDRLGYNTAWLAGTQFSTSAGVLVTEVSRRLL